MLRAWTAYSVRTVTPGSLPWSTGRRHRRGSPAGSRRQGRTTGPAAPRAGRAAGAGRRAQPPLEPVAGEVLDQTLPPLDDGDRLFERRVEVEVVHLGDRAQPVGVDVHQRQPAAVMHARDDEGR